MREWIFKVIYLPIILSVVVVNMSIAGLILKEVGLKQIYGWVLIIGAIAYFAEWYVNK